MIAWIKLWISEIIVAVIISIIIEMLIPEGKNKKYIKVVSGIYILYTIITPLFNSCDIKIDDFNISQNIISVNSESLVVSTYLKSLEEFLKTEIEGVDYKVKTVEIVSNIDYTDIIEIKIQMISALYDEDTIKDIIIKEIDIDREKIFIE